MNAYFRLMRLDKPIGIALLLYPALWALFLAAEGLPDLKLCLIFVLGVVLMRSAGCVINDYADRKIDKLIERTHNRPITTGEIHPKSALILFFIMMMIAFGLVLLTNALTVQLAVIAGFLATLYPFTKRWTHLPQFVLGCAFAMSVPMAFAATKGSVPSEAWWVFFATVVWTVIYDTMYAMADREEDLKIGVKSTAILFAKFDRLIIAILQLILISLLLIIGLVFALKLEYFFMLFMVLGLMIYHQFLIKKREKSAYFKAFLHNQYIGMSVLFGVIFSVSY
ncbi:4-hydroxybenzoate polyprenyltransferase (EC [Bathymodiolus thermophilus thioautotrophic gill symbiont]|uniref:4-hydroxybenzoate octaprenyltransferase n=1 Tax=Bathymodiolus thermophilus thioautotrophic gill symbiont TaxID=2360 RepID=A0A3G3IPV5_9GAMM|nr:4-hydroxybenzoate octaprenyltransferase [Bathymodiolus thermophilus thioautotrophic gill symbiont]AYQ57729.1 4-hydroxybenzoate octaprenyltransferase [Bathymodiolus thermophilus thioautotrophic gill symbiont]CAB5505503.1 4-hydroxybenzoate polyprenyltransferase (EC [Bathymodiolus thermophilus thioautotrophic gill symbiont]